jgi:hypothetical protein
MHRQTRSLVAVAALTLALSLAGCGADTDEAQGEPATGSVSGETSSSPPGRQSTKPAPQEAGATLAVTVDGDQVSPVGERLEMSAGDVLTVRITSDRAGELHVHSSPEQYVEFGQGRTRQRLTIDMPGQVDVEEHDSGALVARLLVQ